MLPVAGISMKADENDLRRYPAHLSMLSDAIYDNRFGRYQKALKALNTIIAARNNYGDLIPLGVVIARIKAYLALDRLQDAATDSQALITAFPHHAAGYYYHAKTLLKSSIKEAYAILDAGLKACQGREDQRMLVALKSDVAFAESGRESRRDPVTSTPKELHHLIFKELGAKERFKVMRVSRAWRDAIQLDKLSWSEWDSGDFEFGGAERGQRAFELASGSVGSIKFDHELLVPASHEIRRNFNALRDMIAKSPQLRTLKLPKDTRLLLPFAQALIDGSLRVGIALKHLSIDCFGGWKNSIIPNLLSALPNLPGLSELSIAGPTCLYDNSWPWPKPGTLSKLRCFRILESAWAFRDGLYCSFPLAMLEIEGLSQAAPNLEVLDASDGPVVVSVDVPTSSSGRTDLRCLKKLTSYTVSLATPHRWSCLPATITRLEIFHGTNPGPPESFGSLPILPNLKHLAYDCDWPLKPLDNGIDTAGPSMWQTILTQSNCQLETLAIHDQGICTLEAPLQNTESSTFEYVKFRHRLPENGHLPIDQWCNVALGSMAFSTITALAHQGQLRSLQMLYFDDRYNKDRTRYLAHLIATSCPSLAELDWHSLPLEGEDFVPICFSFKTKMAKRFRSLVFAGTRCQVLAFSDFPSKFGDKWDSSVYNEVWKTVM